MENNYTDNPDAITLMERHGSLWFKRDDYFMVNGARGGKVRTCLKLLKDAKGAVTYASRTSPQMNYTAQVAEALDIPCRVHVAHGSYTREMNFAVEHGADLVQHKPGYLNNLHRYAQDDAMQAGWRFVPLSMESELAVQGTKMQTTNLPIGQFNRLVVVVGGGLSLAGILHGMFDQVRPHLTGPQVTTAQVVRKLPKVLGITIGKDPKASMGRWCPPWWQSVVTLAKAGVPYDKPMGDAVIAARTLGKLVPQDMEPIRLDPFYEAKCLPHLRAGDLFWIVGIRPTEGV